MSSDLDRLLEETKPYDFQPGDVWVDTALRSDVHEDGVHWSVRADSDGAPELYEPNGPGLVPARETTRIRGGMKLLSRACAVSPTGDLA